LAIFNEDEVVGSHQRLATLISEEMEALSAAADIIRKAIQSARFPEASSERYSDFLAASQIGLRVVNNAGACSQLIDRGYFAQAASHIRDTAETAMLMQLFSEDPAQVRIWRTSGDRRYALFGRSKLREKVKQRDKFAFFDGYFDTFSQFGGHPSAETIIVHHDGKNFQIGPHFNQNLYLWTYRDLAITTWQATDIGGELWNAMVGYEISEKFPDEVERFGVSWAGISKPLDL